MNIFKTLATGDGRIDEANVSSFLGYLLDPNEDHGINDELLKALITYLNRESPDNTLKSFIHDKDENVRNFSSRSQFEFIILLEQAFNLKEVNKKKILDLVIICFEKKNGNKESLAKGVLSNSYSRGDLRHIFLIENKINSGAIVPDQLANQKESSIETLSELLGLTKEDIKKIISLIYITPQCKEAEDTYTAFQSSNTDISSCQLLWNSDDPDKETIVNMLQQILRKDSVGEIEAINEYPKYTIKSFITFINNDFKSAIQEDLFGKNEIHEFDTLENLKDSKQDLLDSASWQTVEGFDQFIKTNFPFLSTKFSYHHPIAIFNSKNVKRGTKIFGFSIQNNLLVIDLILKNYETLKENRELFLEKMSALNCSVKILKPHDLRVTVPGIDTLKSSEIFEILYQIVK